MKRTHEQPEHDVLRADELAKLLRVSIRTVQLQAKAGAIPHRRIGKLYLFDRKTIYQWLKGDAA